LLNTQVPFSEIFINPKLVVSIYVPSFFVDRVRVDVISVEVPFNSAVALLSFHSFSTRDFFVAREKLAPSSYLLQAVNATERINSVAILVIVALFIEEWFLN
jgi:hypothetical protein